MKPLLPCPSCKGLASVLILARDWSASEWGALPPGAAGVIYCVCGAWRKWPARADVVGEAGVTPDRLPRAVLVRLNERGADKQANQGTLL